MQTVILEENYRSKRLVFVKESNQKIQKKKTKQKNNESLFLSRVINTLSIHYLSLLRHTYKSNLSCKKTKNKNKQKNSHTASILFFSLPPQTRNIDTMYTPARPCVCVYVSSRNQKKGEKRQHSHNYWFYLAKLNALEDAPPSNIECLVQYNHLTTRLVGHYKWIRISLGALYLWPSAATTLRLVNRYQEITRRKTVLVHSFK